MWRISLALFAAFLALSGSTTARAEINVADSVEWMTCDADLVVRGTISHVATTKGAGSVVWYTATVKVSETLRGSAPKRLTFAMRHLSGDTPETWYKDGSELVLFLVDGKRRTDEDKDYARAPWTLRSAPWMDQAVVRLGGSKPTRIFDMAFNAESRRDVVLSTIRGAAGTACVARSQNIDVPGSTAAFNALWGGSSVWLRVPVDARLEALGQAWVSSTDYYERVEGVKALAPFPSPANIKLLRGLLADPGFGTVLGKPPYRSYEVRAKAYETLRSWKVAVSRPVTRTPVHGLAAPKKTPD